MFSPYLFKESADGLRLRDYLVLSLVVGLLAWKLIRGVAPGPATWYVHAVALAGLAVASFLVLLRNDFRLRTFDMSAIILAFSVLVVLRTIVFGNYRDPFTVAGAVFFAHLFLASVFARVSDRSFFRGMAFVFGGLAAVEILGILDYVLGWGIVDYAGMEAMEGVAPIEGVYGGQSFILFFLDIEFLQRFFGRLSGIAGTPYASSALMAAIAAFGLASGRKLLTVAAVVALLLSSTGSAVLALFMSAAILYRRKPLMWVPLLLAMPFLVWVFGLKGFDEAGTITEIYLPLQVTKPFFHVLTAAVIGEGRHVSALHGELRIFGVMLSLGFGGLICVAMMVDGWLRGVKLPADAESQREYRAAGYFVLTLTFATIHYPTLFIYPNIAIVLAFLALISSRLRLSRAAALAGPRGVVEV